MWLFERRGKKGRYLAKDIDVGFDYGDVDFDVPYQHAMKFKDRAEVSEYIKSMRFHKEMMIDKYGNDAIISLDIDKVLKKFRLRKVVKR